MGHFRLFLQKEELLKRRIKLNRVNGRPFGTIGAPEQATDLERLGIIVVANI